MLQTEAFGDKVMRKSISDKDGHYDLDGASMIFNRVVVAGDGRRKKQKPAQNSLGTLEEIEKRADMASLEQEGQDPSKGPAPEMDEQIYSANFHSEPEYEDFLKYEKAGD